MSDISKNRRKRRRQKGVLTTLGLVFAISAVLRIGALDIAFAENAAPFDGTETDVDARNTQTSPTSSVPGPATSAAALRTALTEIEDLRDTLQRREAALLDRELAVETAQSLVEARLAELEAVETRLEELIAVSDSAAESDLERLTRVYETMAPERAAALFAEMSPSFAAGFLSRMSPPASAALMAEMTPEVAYAVSVVIATRNASAPTLVQGEADAENDTEN